MAKNIFQETIESIANLEYCTGKGAIPKSYSKQIIVGNCEGSADIDSGTKKQYPQSSRWDYAIGRNGQAYFVEIHPAASGSNFDEMIKKGIMAERMAKHCAQTE